MRWSYIKTGWVMTARALLRSRTVLLLLFVIPTLFYALIILTTKTDHRIAFRLASVSSEAFIQASQRYEALIFIGLTAVGLLTSFLALHLIQKQARVNRRLVLCGYRPSELIASKLTVLLCVIFVVAWYVALMLPLFFAPNRFVLVALGFMLGGYVYGCYGLLVGSIFKRELEAIFFIILLANLDAGWLQNPIYYAEAQNQAIIRHLPAYFPSQVSMVSAFTDYPITNALIGGIGYGSLLLLAAMLIFWLRMKMRG